MCAKYSSLLLLLLAQLFAHCSGAHKQQNRGAGVSAGQEEPGEELSQGEESAQITGAQLVATWEDAGVKSTVKTQKSLPNGNFEIEVESNVTKGQQIADAFDEGLEATWELPFDPNTQETIVVGGKAPKCKIKSVLKLTCTFIIEPSRDYAMGYTLTDTGKDRERLVKTEVFRDLVVWNMYPREGSDQVPNEKYWNYYAKETSTTEKCNPATDANCKRAYLSLMTTIAGISSCVDVDAQDNLGVFIWNCIDYPGANYINIFLGDFKPQKRLDDLIGKNGDGTYFFKEMFAIVTGPLPNSADSFTRYSTIDTWWQNSIVRLGHGSNPTGMQLTEEYTIYIVDIDPPQSPIIEFASVEIAAEGIALVVRKELTLKYNDVSACVLEKWINYGVGGGPAYGNCWIGANAQASFFWLEGDFDGYPPDGDSALNYLIMLSKINYGRIHSTFIKRGTSNLYIYDASGIVLTEVESIRAIVGIQLYQNRGLSTMRRVVAAQNDTGLRFDDGPAAYVYESEFSNNNRGIHNWGAGGTGTNGVYLFQTLLTNNHEGGYFAWMWEGSSTVPRYIQGLTAVANDGYGGFQHSTASAYTSMNNAAFVNNENGVSTGNPERFHNLLSTNNGAWNLYNGLGVNYYGYLGLGSSGQGDCSGAENLLAEEGACTAANPALLDVYQGLDLSGANANTTFVGRVLTGDAAHPNYPAIVSTNGTNGDIPVGDILSYGKFSYFWRGWGKNNVQDPVHPDNRGRCNSGSCVFWDYSLRASDTALLNQTIPKTDTLKCPDPTATITLLPIEDSDALELTTDGVGNNDGVCEGSEVCYRDLVKMNHFSGSPIYFVRNAIEISFDSVGNDNGFCETGERCYLTRNIGAYQGHGQLLHSHTLTNGCADLGVTNPYVNNIELFDYENNGF